ncbi:RICIN domain-containing protein [Saccharothrix sp. S26]|uniref:RICIN domain-containing protein n=1 Tax=Saccharothrix sp. S26 TaxID=2907215 RepID=UPI001F187341|nr:RICIN domain-containing protein [Saccharothrix sp. S26]MCE6998124.1 RICIN domain-containing protein [Saccharothrix sp. S26]
MSVIRAFLIVATIATFIAVPQTAGAASAPSAPAGGLVKVPEETLRELARLHPEKFDRLAARRSAVRTSSTTCGDDGYYWIVNRNSGKYLAIGSSSEANGAHAIQWDYTGSFGQLWDLWGDHLINVNSGKYLAIGESSTANGAHAIQWDYTGSNGQRWRCDNGGHIINVNSGKYLAIGESSTANGAHAIQWENTGSNGQRWDKYRY